MTICLLFSVTVQQLYSIMLLLKKQMKVYFDQRTVYIPEKY